MTSDPTDRFEPRVQAIIGPLRALTASTPEPEVSEAVTSVVQSLHDLVADTESSGIERVECHVAIGQVVLQFSHPSDTRQIDEALLHFRIAFRERSHLLAKEPLGGTAAWLASMFGAALSQRVRQLDPALVAETANEAENALRFAVDTSPLDDRALPGRCANLATHILQYRANREDLDGSEEAILLMERAVGSPVSLSLPLRDQAAFRACLGHCLRRRWQLARSEENPHLELLAAVSGAYKEADALAGTNAPGETVVSTSDWALYHSEVFEVTGDPEALQQAITIGSDALREMPPDDDHRPEASMQLAEHLLVQYERNRDEACLVGAAALSRAAVESPYIDRHGAAHHGLKWRRLEILRTVTGTPGAWSAEQQELRALLDQVITTEGIPPTPEIRCIRLLDDMRSAQRAMPDPAALKDAAFLGDKLRLVVTTATFSKRGLIWCARYADAELGIYENGVFHGCSNDAAIDRLNRAVAVLLARTAETDDLSPDPDRFFSLVIAVECLANVAFGLSSRDVAARAADVATAAMRCAAFLSDKVPAPNVVELGRMAMRLCHYLERPNDHATALRVVIASARLLPKGRAPADALLGGVRLRRSVAADIAASAPNAQAHVLLQMEFCAGLATSEAAQTEYLKSVIRRSINATQVYVAVGNESSRAVVVHNGTSSPVDLGDLTAAKLGPTLTAAYRCHIDAATGIVGASGRWIDARRAFEQQVVAALAPLIQASPTDLPIELHLAGWAHAIPLVPLLSSALGHDTPVSAVLTHGRSSLPQTAVDLAFVGLAVPGTGDAYLAHVLDDVEHADRLFSHGTSTTAIEPSQEHALSLIRRARIVLFAGHAEASTSDPADSRFLLADGPLTVRTLLNEDLRHVDVAMFSACESLAVDAQLHENPLSLATATILAGAGAAVGSHWRVGDGHASQFTRLFLAELAAGVSAVSAYSAALRQSDGDHPTFSIYVGRELPPGCT